MAVAFTEYLNICPPLELIKTSPTETELLAVTAALFALILYTVKILTAEKFSVKSRNAARTVMLPATLFAHYQHISGTNQSFGVGNIDCW